MRKLLANLRRDTRGLALIEFAYAAPIFLTMVLTGLELSNLALAHMRVSQMAMTVADNAGRVTSGIDEANIYEVFAGAEVTAGGIDFEDNGRMVLSSLEDNGKNGSNAGQVITWQRCWGNDTTILPAYGEEGDGADDDSLEDGLGAGTNKIAAMSGTAVMFVEVTYQYQPLVTTGFFDAPTIRYESAFNVRGRQNNAISNTQGLTVHSC
ncbi:TadE/TadG family type IV pilus assembly protein [Qipengyuania flava]|uniref:TadE/TadG family type IV pilus assembly protein n=1 Tax=Qipengyuania flava TaxID=192812 RepID=UPI001C6291F5|nr:TadE/TadG family type IV pilus assembly protein [Qipengyuania flava]QYJ06470.1 pilus assembly protein [Qipengyuania flava]